MNAFIMWDNFKSTNCHICRSSSNILQNLVVFPSSILFFLFIKGRPEKGILSTRIIQKKKRKKKRDLVLKKSYKIIVFIHRVNGRVTQGQSIMLRENTKDVKKKILGQEKLFTFLSFCLYFMKIRLVRSLTLAKQ